MSPERLGAVPAACLAAERRRHVGARARPPTAATSALRKVTHRTLREAEQLVESHRFNVMVARTMELVNATRKAIDTGCGPDDPAVREAAEAVAILLSLVAPYTAEEMWERLGHQPTVARAGWPAVDEALLVEDSVTAVVQVQGKVRARLEVAPDHQRRRPGGRRAGRPGRRSARSTGGRAQGDRARAEAGQHRRRSVSSCAASCEATGRVVVEA